MKKIGFTGTQKGMNVIQNGRLHLTLMDYRRNYDIEFHHGDCVGADMEAHIIAERLHIRTVVHPPDIDKATAFCEGDEIREPKPYIERNHNIVDECDILIATPKTSKEILRSGTWATVRYARKCNKEVIILDPYIEED